MQKAKEKKMTANFNFVFWKEQTTKTEPPWEMSSMNAGRTREADLGPTRRLRRGTS